MIGMTTTFCAAHKGLLAAVTPRVVVVEEAGEVLESHVLTSMHGQVEQLVLIGDHEQLRPKVEGYELKVESGRGYNLDLSLFERLALGVEAGAMPQLSMVTLRQQWRMRPEIADLIRRPIYPLLQDAPRVREYPAVAGMAAPLLWMTHSEPESGQGSHDDSKSKTNAFEADLVVALAEYLTMHGYVGQGRGSRGEIAILTPYVGQLLAIRNRLQGKFVVTVNDRGGRGLAGVCRGCRGECSWLTHIAICTRWLACRHGGGGEGGGAGRGGDRGGSQRDSGQDTAGVRRWVGECDAVQLR